VLWPLFHYLLEESGKNFDRKLWTAYVEANLEFAKVIAKVWKSGDLVWVHDYHLLVLPKLLREQMPALDKDRLKIGKSNETNNIMIGLFLHIPVPSSEVLSVLPVRKKVLEGILNSDLVGS
jgi:trehalose 6-phosphate synthase